MGATKPGKITRGRRCPVGWLPAGPLPKALSSTQKNGSATRWAKLAMEASTLKEDVEIQDRIADAVAVADDDDVPAPPIWIPEKGEELCNLVGSWRILQRVGSHRWTTDDLVTAYVAAEEMPSLMGNSLDNQETTLQLQYLDLGTGNASVLQMVTWFALANNRPLTAIGVEARLEAVQLARRSLSFNLGTAADKPVARIVHGDFRDVCPQFQQQEQQPFNLITGTPPYFRVDFSVQNQLVTSAVIRQGGMPTARQSAPARCEFRGGIEAYCEAASSVLKPETGRFVVCENWLNHDRVLAAAKQYNLHVLRQVEVQGREGRATLFCVYVMKSKSNDEPATRRENLAVRDGHGNWTERYSRTVLGTMSIPNVDVAPEKSG
jgi:tRNA1Val (adenine37-N6)-methyltransferase